MVNFSLPLLFLLILTASAVGTAAHSHSRHIHPRPHHRHRNRNSTAITLSPPPPPLAPPPRGDNSTAAASRQQQLNNIINALIGSGDFNNWANILSMASPSYLPLSATFFIPADESLVTAAPGVDAFATDPLVFPYHIVPQRLTFAELKQFGTLSRLPTLLGSKTILLTNNSAANFTLDGALLSHPDLFTSPAIVVHGISNLMDYSVYGDGALHTTSSSDRVPQISGRSPQISGRSPKTPNGQLGFGIRHSGAGCMKGFVLVNFLFVLCCAWTVFLLI